MNHERFASAYEQLYYECLALDCTDPTSSEPCDWHFWISCGLSVQTFLGTL